MGIIRELDRLEPELAKRAKSFLSECRTRGIDVLVTETLRTDDIQATYFSRGRERRMKRYASFIKKRVFTTFQRQRQK